MLRSEESDAFATGDLGASDATDARLRAVDDGGGMSTESFESLDFNDATRLAVDEDNAVICIGGSGAGGFGTFWSEAETVYANNQYPHLYIIFHGLNDYSPFLVCDP